MRNFLFIPFLIFIPLFDLSAQEHEQEEREQKTGFFRVSASIGHTYLPKDTRVGKDVAILPSFGLDIEYWFNHRIGVGFHNDLELLHFQVREEHDIIIERNYPLLITFDVMYQPVPRLTFYFGPGMELEKHENFFVTRIGIEYEIDIRNGWDVHPVLFYDARRDAYDTFSLGLGFGKRL